MLVVSSFYASRLSSRDATRRISAPDLLLLLSISSVAAEQHATAHGKYHRVKS